MRRNRLPIETLLLDEGFGTLDRHSLDADIGVPQHMTSFGYDNGHYPPSVNLNQEPPD